jgi:hypothetical protein
MYWPHYREDWIEVPTCLDPRSSAGPTHHCGRGHAYNVPHPPAATQDARRGNLSQ